MQTTEAIATQSVWDRCGTAAGPSLAELDSAIAELSAHIDTATHRLLVLIAEFDRREGWAAGGFASCAHWLNVRIGLGLVAARERVRVARALEQLPRISEAMSGGQLSYSKVRAVTRIATRDNEPDLLALARSAPASHVERVVREYRRVGRAGLELAQRQQQGRYLRTFFDADGMLVIEGRLSPEVGALLLQALERAEADADASAESSGYRNGAQPGEPRPRQDQRRADALGRVAEQALSAPGPQRRGEPFQVVVHVDAEVLAEPSGEGQCCIEHGPALSGETARRLSCDAPVVELVESSDGQPLCIVCSARPPHRTAGRKSRRVSTALWRALRSRDRECAFVGCSRQGQQVHHIRHWAEGGETSASNTVLLCRACHWRVHEGGFSVRGEAPDRLTFLDPQGRELTDRFEPPALPADPVVALEAEHVRRGLAIDERTGGIDWWGERLDLDAAVSGLLRRGLLGLRDPQLHATEGVRDPG